MFQAHLPCSQKEVNTEPNRYFAYNLATKSADSIREKLKTAIQRKSRPSLERAINEAEAARYPELAYDLRQARDTLESLGGGRGG